MRLGLFTRIYEVPVTPTLSMFPTKINPCDGVLTGFHQGPPLFKGLIFLFIIILHFLICFIISSTLLNNPSTPPEIGFWFTCSRPKLPIELQPFGSPLTIQSAQGFPLLSGENFLHPGSIKPHENPQSLLRWCGSQRIIRKLKYSEEQFSFCYIRSPPFRVKPPVM